MKALARILRLGGLFGAVLAMVTVSTTAAFAQVAPPGGGGVSSAAAPVSSTTTTAANAGLAPWAIVMLIAVAIAVGAGLSELVHVSRRRHDAQQLATA